MLPTPRFSGEFFAGDLGYAIYVPPGASTLTVELVPEDPYFEIDLVMRFGSDVGFSGASKLRFDYIASGGVGTKQLVITSRSSPPLQPGTYYIGFNVVSSGRTILTLTATVEGGSVKPIRTLAVSPFDNDLDGWVRNSASTNPPASAAEWQAIGGNPTGFARYFANDPPDTDALVAPAKFLGDLSGYTEPRYEFDFMALTGGDPIYPVEIRMSGAGATFSWLGSVPPPPAVNIDPCIRLEMNPKTGRFECVVAANIWTHYAAPLEARWWERISGEATFAQVLANVQRVEVITGLTLYGGSSGIDNFALNTRGPGGPGKVLPGNTSFLSGVDAWTRNFPASEIAGATTGNTNSIFRWVPFEGNPNGYIRLTDTGGSSRDYAVAPGLFLGDYRGLTSPQFEFDYLHNSPFGATRPVEMRLLGAESVFAWTGGIPTNTWTHYVAPLTASLWRRVSGNASLADALANVERLEISMDQAEGPESNAIDNFWLLPGPISPAPPAISANPPALTFSGTMRGSNPAPQSISVTSIGGGTPLGFSVSASSNWLRVSAGNGTTPKTLNVWADIANLPEGTYTGSVSVTAGGVSLGPQTVGVTLKVNARSGPIPRLNVGGTVNAGTNRTQLAAGGLGTIYGTGLGPAAGVAASFVGNTSSLPTRLQGVRVLVNEGYGALIAEAPLLYISDTQINFQLPFEASGRAAVLLVVDNNGSLSDPQTVQVVAKAPGIFTYGSNRAVAVNEDNSVNSTENGAARGSVLTVYMTGQGTVTPSVPTGSAAPSRPLSRVPFPTRAWIAGVPAQVLFVGLTPGLVGVLQVNLVVPSGAPEGDWPLLINILEWSSNTPVVTVR